MTNIYPTPMFTQAINVPMGLAISTISNTTLSVSQGVIMDENYTQNIFVDTPIVINSAIVGAGGLDTGTVAVSTLYYVYLIDADDRVNFTTSAIISTSATAPVIPYGYDKKKLIGIARVDGSGYFLNLVHRGSGFIREYWFDTPISVLSGGTATSFTAVDLTGYIPVAIGKATFNASFTPNVAADACALSIGGSSSTTGVVTISGVVAAKAQIVQVAVPVGVVASKPEIQYKVAASGSLSLSLTAFTINLE